jgi:hypothetical protein
MRGARSKLEKAWNILREIEQGKAGLVVYSTGKAEVIGSMNGDMVIPLASAAKAAIGFAIARLVEEGGFTWDDVVENISFNPAEDSQELYPHLQDRSSLSLREAVEVMIACHDSHVAKSVVNHCGGWKKVNGGIQELYPAIHVTENPRDPENKGRLDEIHQLIIDVFMNYKKNPMMWSPIINGLVRQQGGAEGIPSYHLNHMTGGLQKAVVDIGILGDFKDHPLIYALAAVNVPDRSTHTLADLMILDALNLLYTEQKEKKE